MNQSKYVIAAALCLALMGCGGGGGGSTEPDNRTTIQKIDAEVDMFCADHGKTMATNPKYTEPGKTVIDVYCVDKTTTEMTFDANGVRIR